MNCFCKLESKIGTHQTKPQSKGDTCPKWNENFTFDVKDQNEPLTVTVFDKETMKADDLVGSVKLKFTDVCVDGQLDKWVKLEHNGKPAGEVHLKGKFTPTP